MGLIWEPLSSSDSVQGGMGILMVLLEEKKVFTASSLSSEVCWCMPRRSRQAVFRDGGVEEGASGACASYLDSYGSSGLVNAESATSLTPYHYCYGGRCHLRLLAGKNQIGDYLKHNLQGSFLRRQFAPRSATRMWKTLAQISITILL